ncbi:MAG: ParA family protein [Thiovulaceae bacterium]|nr:ParA family protein [Sulfurimonadaceae bacterium]
MPIISVSHQKGGVGKSTLAYNLAVELSKKFDVEVIDLDVQETVSSYNRIRKIMGQEPLKVKIFTDHDELVHYFNIVDENKIVIVDSGGFDSALNRLSILAADFILTPVSSEFTELLGLEKYNQILQQISEQTGNTIIANVVLNKINPTQKHFDELIDFINNTDHFMKLDSVLRRRVDFANSVGHGFSVNELDASSESSKEMNQLVQEIISKGILNG